MVTADLAATRIVHGAGDAVQHLVGDFLASAIRKAGGVWLCTVDAELAQTVARNGTGQAVLEMAADLYYSRTVLGFGTMAMALPAFGAATPAGIMRLLAHYAIPLAGKHAVVVGRSPILGKPAAMMLLNANATVTICHSRTEGLADLVRQADIVVGAVGKPRFIQGDWIKDGAVIIDAGYHPGGVGDIELDSAIARCYAYTPVPGGVGPMTIAMLMTQTVEAAEARY